MTTTIHWRDGSLLSRKPPPKKSAKGDDVGHEFHGNQWTGGIGGEGDFSVGAGGVLQGNATLKGEAVDNHLAGADGQPVQFSVDAITHDIVEVRPGVKMTAAQEKATKTFDSDVRTKVKDLLGAKAMKEHGIDSIDGHLKSVADSAIARYGEKTDVYVDKQGNRIEGDPEAIRTMNPDARLVAGPTLVERDKFYEQWNYTTKELSKETGIDQERIVAAMSAISPKHDAVQNLRDGGDLTRMVAANDGRGVKIPDPEATAQDFDERAAAYREAAAAGRKADWATEKADELDQSAADLRSGKAEYMNDLRGFSAAQFAQRFEAQQPTGDMGELPIHPSASDDYDRRGRPGVGLQVTASYEYYANAVNVLRGFEYDGQGERQPFDVDDTVRGVKTRSFVNNIMDPNDESHAGSVTVDFHAVDNAFGVIGSLEENSKWTSSPRIAGVQIGVRAHVADSIRNLVPYLAEKLDDPTISPARVQEILWAEWDRSTTAPRNGAPSYQGYDGGTFDVIDRRVKEAK